MKIIQSFTKIYVCIMILGLRSSIGIAQDIRFLVSYSPIIPVSFMEDANIGLISADIGFCIDFTNNVSWLSVLGYNKFGTRTATIHGTDDEYKSRLTFIPVTTGIQYFFKGIGTTHYSLKQKRIRPYSFLKAGYYFPSNDLVKGDFGFNAGGGVQISLKNGKSKFDISLCYNGVSGAKTKVFEIGSISQESTFHYLSYIGISMGVVFGL